MRVERGASQVLFGMLPGQTADLESRIWKVAHWVDPVPIPLDQDAVRAALIGAIAPWTATGMDDGLEQELRARRRVEVVGLNMERGVLVETFPEQWRCKQCGSIARARDERCSCGGRSRAQMQFVTYHSCGASGPPQLPRCRVHNAVAVRLPGTATAKELRFFCPQCRTPLTSGGFPFQPCTCGNGGMLVTVHRAAVVFSPRFAVLVNPPDPADAARLRAAGGGARALEWVLDGMVADDPTAGRQTLAGLVETFRQAGLSEETARRFAQDAVDQGEADPGNSGGGTPLPDAVREKAHEEALSLASAARGGRTRVTDLVAGTTPPLRTLYEGAYHEAIRSAHLEGVELLANFPVATLAFAFTRGDLTPGAARLVPFRERGFVRAYGSLSRTEALLFRLDPLRVYQHLVDLGHGLPAIADARAARTALLQRIDIPHATEEQYQPLGGDLLRLVHSYAHRTIRRLAAFAGIERDGLAEYLLPHHLSFVVYAASRGDFVLGGLQAVFETTLHRFLADLVTGESRCALDPGCRSGGGACMACLHLGEPSCRWFNRFLDRSSCSARAGSSWRFNAMDDAELVGGVLLEAADPRADASQLARLVLESRPDRAAASRAGFHPDLVDVLRARLGADAQHVETICQEGAAWVLGRRSIVVNEPWDLVASLSVGVALPSGLRRTTGETLVQLAAQSRRTLRLAAPFVDRSGLGFIGDALSAATARGVSLELMLPTRSTHADDALDELEATIRRSGAITNYRTSRLRFDAPWAHLKVMTSDSIAAYIGSANVTGAGIAGRNLELGVLVRGETVTVVEQVLDLYRQS